MLLRGLMFAIVLFVFNGVHAANKLTITLEQKELVSNLKLFSYYDRDIIWEDEQGNPTRLPEEISRSASTSFYGIDNHGFFDLGVLYDIEENGSLIKDSLFIEMDEMSCYVNGLEEYSFATHRYSYYVTTEISPFVPDAVTCSVFIKIEQHPVPTSENENAGSLLTVPQNIRAIVYAGKDDETGLENYYVASANRGIYHGDGISWTQLGDILVNDVCGLVLSQNNLYATGLSDDPSGVYKWTGETWIHVGDTATGNKEVWTLIANENTFYAGTWGAGVWGFDKE